MQAKSSFFLLGQDFCTHKVLSKGTIACLCMDNTQKPHVKTKGFYSKNAKYKKKIRSLLFPCTVFHSDKTSRLHAAQNTAPERIRKAHHPELLFIYLSYIHKSATRLPATRRTHTHTVKAGKGPCSSEGVAAAVLPKSRHPTNRAGVVALPREVPKSEEERRKENNGSSCGSLEWEGNQINK